MTEAELTEEAAMLAAQLEAAFPGAPRTEAVASFAAMWGITPGAVWRGLRGDTKRLMVPLRTALEHVERARTGTEKAK